MNLKKIGNFISECRKKQNLTQAQLAEKLHITDRAVSKWETGRALPDSSIMIKLCDILCISVNDLLSGEIVMKEEKDNNQEQIILELVKEKQQSDRRLLKIEIYIGILSTLILLGLVLYAAYSNIETWLRIVLIVVGFLVGLIGFAIALKIEQVAGYYECKKCGYRYVPTYKAVNLAPHIGRTRYLKCPHCGQKSWNKKVIEK